MKICHFSTVHDRYDPRVFQKECCSLAKYGYDVTYIVNDDRPDEFINGVNIISTGLKKSSHIDRIFKSTRIVKKLALRENADIFHFHDPELIPVGLYLKKKGYLVIDDVHEDVPRDILSKKWIPIFLRKPISYVIEEYEKKNLSRIDYLITVSPFLVDRLVKINPNVAQVTNYPIVDNVNPISKSHYLSRKANICFTGAVSSAWQHKDILDSLNHIDCKYIIAGKKEPGYLETLTGHIEYSKVDYRGVVPSKDVVKIFNESRIGMAIADYRPGAGYKKGTLGNTKIYEYMRAGIPIICTDFEVWQEQIRKHNCGICVNPQNSIEIKKAIEYLLSNPDAAYEMGQNGQRAVMQEYNWNSQFQNLIQVYQTLKK